MRKRLSGWAVALVVVLAHVMTSAAFAQSDKLKKEELDQLLAPIALYPDDLLSNVLMASTYPLDVVQAARWKGANGQIKGDALTKALEPKEWDPSVKALVPFPKVLEMMSEKLEWTQKLGDAFLAQQDDVMDEIQVLRAKADGAGSLKSNKQQTVSKEAGSDAQPIYVIAPATPDTIYVPVYEPTVVYGPWWYPDYPPYYWTYPGASFVNGFFWGAGVAVASGIWGWNHFDWHHHDIDIDVNKWNNINVNRANITSGKWEHRPDHRGPVPYKNKEVRDKFNKGERPREASKDFRGFDKTNIDRTNIESKLKDGGANLKDKAGNLPKAGDLAKGGGQKIDRDIDRPKAKPASRPSPGAFDVKRGADVKRSADRGKASRVSMSGPRGGGGARGGGGGRRR